MFVNPSWFRITLPAQIRLWPLRLATLRFRSSAWLDSSCNIVGSIVKLMTSTRALFPAPPAACCPPIPAGTSPTTRPRQSCRSRLAFGVDAISRGIRDRRRRQSGGWPSSADQERQRTDTAPSEIVERDPSRPRRAGAVSPHGSSGPRPAAARSAPAPAPRGSAGRTPASTGRHRSEPAHPPASTAMAKTNTHADATVLASS